MSSVDCGDTEQFYNNIVYPILFAIAAITLLLPIYFYIKAYINQTLKSSKSMFYAGLVFFLNIFIFYVSYATNCGVYCHGISHWIVQAPPFYLYTMQAVLLLLILFMRLILIFKGLPSLSLSPWTITIYLILTATCLFAACIGFTMALFLATPQNQGIGFILSSMALPIYIILVLWLNILFIIKLYRVYKTSEPTKTGKESGKENDKLVEIITKTTILSMISTLMIFVFSCFYILLFSIGIDKYLLGTRLFLIGDLHTNFMSILLSFNYFNGWYRKLCGNCHWCCVRCWNKISHDDDVMNLVTELGSVESQSPTSRNEI